MFLRQLPAVLASLVLGPFTLVAALLLERPRVRARGTDGAGAPPTG